MNKPLDSMLELQNKLNIDIAILNNNIDLNPEVILFEYGYLFNNVFEELRMSNK